MNRKDLKKYVRGIGTGACTLNLLADDAHGTARNKGFWPKLLGRPLAWQSGRLAQYAVMEKLALIHAEVSEAVEVVRDHEGTAAKLTEELADVIIRTLDLAAACGFDIGDAVVSKLAKNRTRLLMHGKKF